MQCRDRETPKREEEEDTSEVSNEGKESGGEASHAIPLPRLSMGTGMSGVVHRTQDMTGRHGEWPIRWCVGVGGGNRS